ncbi:MAG: hypothetical protein CXZ00_11825 [Acidobacteria bacterium]|nr:MAG: hypothetical protein CXZ00_11825 [Acidobacteriota bacterium]
MKFRNRMLLCFTSLFTPLLLATNLFAQSRQVFADPLNARASSRISMSISDRADHILPGNRHPFARREFEAGAVSSTAQMQRMVLVLKSSAAQEIALDALLDAQRNPTSAYFHQWLSPEQFAEHFGASVEDVQRITNWLQSHGMQIDEVASSRRSITFSGSASQVEHAFATAIRRYKVNGAVHVANATDPRIPSALAPVVAGVLSLHDFPLKRMHSSIHSPVAQITYGTSHYVTPADLATIYNVNPLFTQGIDGSGQSVAVVGRSNINLSDVRAFRSKFSLPANDPQVIVNGSDPGTANFTELVEATLDVEYAGALARQSTVKLVASASTTASDGVFLAAQYAVNQNLAPIITMSYSECEAQLGSAGSAFINGLWKQAAAQGITVLVASGDSGAAGCDSTSSSVATHGLGVNGLCSTPYNLCVGGTQFNDTANPSQYWSSTNSSATSASALSYIPEVAWNETAYGLYAGGGGRSTTYSKPSWQSGPGVPADGKRDVPDISLASAGHDGYIILVGGQQYSVAGTSAASPTLAGLLALVVQSTGAWQGVAAPTLYSLASKQSSSGSGVFHDVISGNNSVPGVAGFSAGAGFDLATGLGSVDANALVTHWRDGQTSTVQPSLTVSASATSITMLPGSSQGISISTVGNSALNSAVVLNVSGLPAGMSATFTPSTIAAPGSGTTTLSLQASSTVQTGSYLVTITAAAGSLTKNVQFTLNVPSLTASASTTSLSLMRDASSSVMLTTDTSGGFNAAVTISVSGVPLGVTASTASVPSPGAGAVSITFTATSEATIGPATVTITASGGGLAATVPVTLAILTPRAQAAQPIGGSAPMYVNVGGN